MDKSVLKEAEKPNVKLIADLQGIEFIHFGSEETSVYGAMGCFGQETPIEMFEKDYNSKKDIDGIKEKIFAETAGRAHGAVLDQNSFTFNIKGLSRLTTLQLCQPLYLSHLQQSMRRVTVDSGVQLPDAILESNFLEKTLDLMNESFALYSEMDSKKIPTEDARYILPLSVRTNIQTTGDAREFMHLYDMSTQDYTPSLIRDVVEDMMMQLKKNSPKMFEDRENNYENRSWYPCPQLFSPENETLKKIINGVNGVQNNYKTYLINPTYFHMSDDTIKKAIIGKDYAELNNLKQIKFKFLFPLSLSAYHQAVRQRTWNHDVEPIYDGIKRGEIIIPPIIEKSDFSQKYDSMNKRMLELYSDLIGGGIPKQEALVVIPHSLKVHDIGEIDGWNAIYSLPLRTCQKAQWEIRNIATDMAHKISKINPTLGEYATYRGKLYENGCPEKKSCHRCD